MTNTNTEINFQDLLNLIEEVTHGDYRTYDGYSGRGMYGRMSRDLHRCPPTLGGAF